MIKKATNVNGIIPGLHAHLNTQSTPCCPRIFRIIIANGALFTFRIFIKPVCGKRVSTRMTAIMPYGSQAITVDICFSVLSLSDSVSTTAERQWLSHSDGSGNSNLFFGIKNPFFAAIMVAPRPMIAASNEGKSGPIIIASKIYGMSKTIAEKRINGIHSTAGRILFSFP